MSFSVEKRAGRLLFTDHGGYQTRNPSTFWCIEKADERYHFKDFPKLTIHTEDYESSTEDYTYSKQNSYAKLVPDFNFHAWPQVGIHDYERFTWEIHNAGLSRPKINKVGWIGNTATNERRKTLLEIGHNNPQLFDIIDMNWNSAGGSRYIATPELVKKYSILVDIEGNGYSGRLKHLLWSHRPVLLVDRPHKEFFFEFLQEWKHYIPVKRDLSDLVEKTKWCIHNYGKALQIAENAYQFSKLHLTRNACYSKWNQIISKHLENTLEFCIVP